MIALRAALVLIATAAYLALPIVAWGGVAAFFAHPPFVALAVVLLLIALLAVRAGGGISAGEREDRANRWVLWAFTVLGLAIGFFPAYADRLNVWTFDGDAVRWLGVVMFAVGCVVRIVPVFVLGNRFSGLVAIQPGHALVTTGVYGTIRHPSYLGVLLFLAGWSLVFRSGIGLVLTLVMLVPLVARINAEERLLRSQFGAEYDAYRARTARLIPGIY